MPRVHHHMSPIITLMHIMPESREDTGMHHSRAAKVGIKKYLTHNSSLPVCVKVVVVCSSATWLELNMHISSKDSLLLILEEELEQS